MSINVGIQVQQGLSEALENYAEQFPLAITSALKTVADRVLDTSDVLVPVRTGFLKSTLGFRQDSPLQMTFFATAPYAPYVEWGTKRMSARLFLTRSIEQHTTEFPLEVQNALQQLRDNFFIT